MKKTFMLACLVGLVGIMGLFVACGDSKKQEASKADTKTEKMDAGTTDNATDNAMDSDMNHDHSDDMKADDAKANN